MIKNLKVYKKCLIVVDMVNGFVKEGVLHDKEISKTIPRQIELIKDYNYNNQLVVFIKDTHEEDAIEFKRFGNTKHCVKGTTEAELVDELKPYENKDNTISIEKNSTSYMESLAFRELIGNLNNLETVDVVGCCTDICCFNGTMGLANYFDQWNKNVEIRMNTDAIATYNEENRKQYIDASYLLMEQQGIKLVREK